MKANRWAIAGGLAVMVAAIAAMQVAPAQEETRRARQPSPTQGGFGGGEGGFGGGEFGGGEFGGGDGFGGGFGGEGGFGGGGEFGGGFGGEFGGGFVEASRPGAAPPKVLRHWVNSDVERTDALIAKLNERMDEEGLDFVETPLEEVVVFLNHQYGLGLQVNHSALDDVGIDAAEPITFQMRDATVGAAIRFALDPLELRLALVDGVLFITTEDDASSEERLLTAVYPVADLLLDGDFDSLIDSIVATISPNSWAENGGGEAEIRPHYQRGCVIVSQTLGAHRRIGTLFTALRQVERDPDARLPEPQSNPFGGQGSGAFRPAPQ